jgi:hypothetical protein
MQPYVFPYIGYFHLIEATDKIVFYDDVSYINRGWINRNRILLNNKDFLFTIPISNASQNKRINEIKPLIDNKFKNKFYTQLEIAYKNAPYYFEVKELIYFVLNEQYNNIADLAIKSITTIYDYLEKEINWTKSSVCSPFSNGLDRSDRLIQISKELGCTVYINSNGGQKIYDKEYFKNQGVQLNFIESKKVEYKQFKNDFIPWLSIIDILMFNDKKNIQNQFNAFCIL